MIVLNGNLGTREGGEVHRSVFALNLPEEAMRLTADASGEEEFIGFTGGSSIAGGQAPQAINHDGSAPLVRQLAEESARIRAIVVAKPCPEVAYYQRLAKVPKVARSDRQAQGRTALAWANHPLATSSLGSKA